MNRFELAYREAKKTDPTASYARTAGKLIFEQLSKAGGAHATLGENLTREEDWEVSGFRLFSGSFGSSACSQAPAFWNMAAAA